MHYIGGKYRIADELIRALNAVRLPSQVYVEPFMGAAHVLSRMRGTRFGSDVHRDLVLMWEGIRDGTYNPPLSVSEEEYNELKDAPSSAHRGFVGFACSYGGKWFAGYARGAKQNGTNPERESWYEDTYVMQARRSVLQLRSSLQSVDLFCQSYEEWSGEIKHGLIYCDPPYAQTTKYKGTTDFDHQLFWHTVADWSADNTVLVSEYTAPEEFEPIWQIGTKTSMRVKDANIAIGRHDPRVESLFIYKGARDYERVKGILQEGHNLFRHSVHIEEYIHAR